MDKTFEQIKLDLPEIIKQGAFIFDVDNTLVAPDDSFENYPELLDCLRAALKQGVRIALVSGSPGAVIENRIQALLGSGGFDFQLLTIYTGGGSTKFTIGNTGKFQELQAYQEGCRIPSSCLESVRSALTRYVHSGFDLENMMDLEKVKDAWFRKRMEQWSELSIEFDDSWFRGDKWEIGFLDDEKMASVKAKKGSAKTTFPFINVRQALYDSENNMESCSSFSPTGFYVLSENQKDGIDLDLRDWIIDRLKEDLGEWGGELNFYKAGRSTIDITHRKLSKASAIKDYIVSNKLDSRYVYYIGDEFFEGGNDIVLAGSEFLDETPINLLSVNAEEPNISQARWVGSGPSATLELLKGTFRS